MITVTIPMRLVSEANARGHWGKGSGRARVQRCDVYWHLLSASVQPSDKRARWTVTLTRIAPRKLDGDNLQRALKAVRDGVADWLGIDDGSERIEWRYGQERGAVRGYAVRIEVERG